jgi:hypothetical protein
VNKFWLALKGYPLDSQQEKSKNNICEHYIIQGAFQIIVVLIVAIQTLNNSQKQL